MAHYLLDTGLVLRHLRGQRRAVRLLSGLGKTDRLAISAITRLEVHAGMRAEEKYATGKLLSRFITHDVTCDLAERAGDLIRESRNERNSLSVPDAIIAATALMHGLTLVTLNQADFSTIPGLSLEPLHDELTS